MSPVPIANILRIQSSCLQVNLLNEPLPAVGVSCLDINEDGHAVSVKLDCVREKANFPAFVVKSNSLACVISTMAGYIAYVISIKQAFLHVMGGQYQYVFSSNSYIHKPSCQDSNFYRSMRGILRKAGLWQKAVWRRCSSGKDIRAWQIIWDEPGTFMLQWGSLNKLNVMNTRFFRLL